MRNIKLTLEYDGGRFEGWQIQGKKHRTVQGELKKALKRILHEDVTVIGSGRTDSGVHALGQVANFKTSSSFETNKIVRAMNAVLPDDIAVIKAQEVPLTFHAQYDVQWKTYRYTILNRQARGGLSRDIALFFPYNLDIKLMKEEAKSLIGRHDFKSFQSANPSNNEQDTTRTIKKLSIKKDKDFIFIEITASGFLFKMVRNIVGTLLEIGSKRLKQGSIQKILKLKNRHFAGPTVRAHALTLMKVEY